MRGLQTAPRSPMQLDGGGKPVLRCRDMHKRFGSTVALAGVDLQLFEGEILAVSGESGSGKSTLLLCMAGILALDEGAVVFRGQDLADMPDSKRTALRRTEFGFVFQLGHLVADLPAVVNVALPLMLNGTPRSQAQSAARRWLGRFGVEDLADRRPGDMSVGESQRVAVARSLVSRPTVVFADEPTGSLDSGNAGIVIQMLVEAAREDGAAVVLVTHSPAIARLADRELVMRDGAIDGAAR